MEEPREIELGEARLALSHEIKQMATEHGLTGEDRARAESLRTQLLSILQSPQTEEITEQLHQLISAYQAVYERIDNEKGGATKFRFAVNLEIASVFLDADNVEYALEELYQARWMIDQEEPRDEEFIDKIDALYKQVKELITE